jgi:hypothetical protein
MILWRERLTNGVFPTEPTNPSTARDVKVLLANDPLRRAEDIAEIIIITPTRSSL